MTKDQELESGKAGQHSAQASILHRLMTSLSRALNPRAIGNQPDRKPGVVEPEKPDPEKGHYSRAENEEACAKVWSIYVGEAERYDAALVESWRADMEGMLIFSGLFSASLTAFLIESYENLQPDSGDLTVATLSQISQQLAALAIDQPFALQTPPPFKPTTASLWCNALWFISLSLSLTCALLATLVEQWAREFLHKTEMRPSPIRRARVFTFLYFGLKQFRMHTLVDAIPFLLHASLFLFFAGLVAFLVPVNPIMMYLICGALCIFVVLYTVLTILPIVRLDCPYRTPLSTLLWSLLQGSWRFWATTESSLGLTMTEAVVGSALLDTTNRDQRALHWTLDSLTDDTELLPFVEAIPDMIYGPSGFRRVNDSLFDGLLGTVEIPSPLVARISNLIAGTEGMSPEDPLRDRRRVAGQRALWALCMMPCAWDRYFDIDPVFFDRLTENISRTVALAIRFQAQRWSYSLVGEIQELLAQGRFLPMVPRLLRLLLKQEDLVASPFSLLFSPSPPNACSPYFAELKASYANSGDSMPNPSQLEKIRLIVTTLHESHEWAYSSLVFVGLFVQRGLDLASFDHTDQPHASFEPKRTCYTILSEIESNPPRRLVTEHTLTSFPPGIQKLEFWWSSPREIDVLAQIVFRMFGFFADCQIDTYLGERRDTGAIEYALKDCDLVALARRLASDLLNQGDHSLWGHRTILQITTVANCVNPDSVAIHFIDEVLAHGPPVISRQSAIMAIRYLRCLRQLLRELFDMVVSSLPESTFFPRLQQICQGELLRPLSPMFLPPDVNIGSVITSLRIHLLNNYISFLSDFFQNMIPAEARSTISPFNLPFNLPSSMHWTDIDHEIQNGFFAAILAHTQSLAHPQSLMSSSTRAMDADLWASDLFWINYHWEGPGPSVHGILPTCLELLRESLELYHATAKTWSEDGAEIDTTSSRRLLEEVKKTLERTGPASGASTAQGGELPEPQRTDIDEAISVEHADSVSANWASF